MSLIPSYSDMETSYIIHEVGNTGSKSDSSFDSANSIPLHKKIRITEYPDFSFNYNNLNNESEADTINEQTHSSDHLQYPQQTEILLFKQKINPNSYIKLTLSSEVIKNFEPINYTFYEKDLYDENGKAREDLKLYIGRSIDKKFQVKIPSDKKISMIVSRNHSMIDMKEGFISTQTSRCAIYAFLGLTKQKGNRKYNASCQLPREILQKIFEYIKSPLEFKLYDLGSLGGTYIKIRQDDNIMLRCGNEICFDNTDYYIHIKKIDKVNPNDFYKFLYEERMQDKSRIIGLTGDQASVLDQIIIKNKGMEEWKDSIGFNEPLDYIKFTIEDKNIDNKAFRRTQSYVLLNQKPVFKLGRSFDNDIHFPINQISRHQCRIEYKHNTHNNGKSFSKGWYINDGSIDKPSSKGTWLSLTNKYERYNRDTSTGFVLKNQDVIKISTAYTLKFSMNN